MTDKERNAWEDGQEYEQNSIVIDLLESTDKISVIHAIFGKASELARKEKNDKRKAELESYSEGFRHALNILQNYGDALEAYHEIINPSIKIDLTESDVTKYS